MTSKRTMAGLVGALLLALVLTPLLAASALAAPTPHPSAHHRVVGSDGAALSAPVPGPLLTEDEALNDQGQLQDGRLRRARNLIVCAVALGFIGVVLGAAALFRRR